MKTTKTTKSRPHFVEAWTDAGLGDEAIFYQEEAAIRWLCDVTRDGGRGWIVVHDHDESEECECHQYLTSHLPCVVDGEEVND